MNKQELISEIENLYNNAVDRSWFKTQLSAYLDHYSPEYATQKSGAWKPEIGEKVYIPIFYEYTDDFYSEENWRGNEGSSQISSFNRGLICKTPEEATQLAYRMLTIARKWRPIIDNIYYSWSFEKNKPECFVTCGNYINNNVQMGNCFPTQEECEEWATKCGWKK